MNYLEAVIFDMDGVIINSEPLHEKTNQLLYQELGIEVSDKESSDFIGLSIDYKWSTLKEKYGLEEEVSELIEKQRIKNMELIKNEDIEAIPGIKTLLQELSKNNVVIALASSSPFEHIKIVLQKLNLTSYFEETISGAAMERGKPNPDIFLHTSQKISVDPENIVVIEDSGNGVKAAVKAGMKCIAYKNPDSGNQDLSGADLIVNKITEINIGLLKSLFV